MMMGNIMVDSEEERIAKCKSCQDFNEGEGSEDCIGCLYAVYPIWWSKDRINREGKELTNNHKPTKQGDHT